MTSLFVLIPLGFVLLAIAAAAFVWAVRHDQFDDLSRPAHSILFDDDLRPAQVRLTVSRPARAARIARRDSAPPHAPTSGGGESG